MIYPRVAMKITQELLSYVQHNVEKYEDHLLQDGKVDGPAITEPGQTFVVLLTLATMCFPESSSGIHCSSSSIVSILDSHAPIMSTAI